MPLANSFTYLLQFAPWATYTIVGLFSLLIGSFFNVMIHRLPIMMERDWKTQCAELLQCESGISTEPYNLVIPRSACPKCDHQIRWYENIPVVSYLLILRAKCSNCLAPISFQYPAIEIITAVMAITCLSVLGITAQGFFAIIFSWLLLILAVIDLKTTYLPDTLNYILLWLGLLLSTQTLFIDTTNSIIGAAAGYLILWSVYWLFKLVTKKEGMGHGDFKLLAAIGAWTSIHLLPAVIIISSVIGSIIGIAMIIFRGHKRQTPIPFGPYLAIAGWLCMLWGDKIQLFIGR